jgi:5-methylcytosine-specific restriction enzyme A
MKPPMGDGRRVPHTWPARERIRGRRLQHLRAQLLAAQPCCALCQRVLMPGQWVRDHVVPLAEGGQDEPGNVQGLCFGCHDAKTQDEAKRGVVRTNALQGTSGGRR